MLCKTHGQVRCCEKRHPLSTELRFRVGPVLSSMRQMAAVASSCKLFGHSRVEYLSGRAWFLIVGRRADSGCDDARSWEFLREEVLTTYHT